MEEQRADSGETRPQVRLERGQAASTGVRIVRLVGDREPCPEGQTRPAGWIGSARRMGDRRCAISGEPRTHHVGGRGLPNHKIWCVARTLQMPRSVFFHSHRPMGLLRLRCFQVDLGAHKLLDEQSSDGGGQGASWLGPVIALRRSSPLDTQLSPPLLPRSSPEMREIAQHMSRREISLDPLSDPSPVAFWPGW